MVPDKTGTAPGTCAECRASSRREYPAEAIGDALRRSRHRVRVEPSGCDGAVAR